MAPHARRTSSLSPTSSSRRLWRRIGLATLAGAVTLAPLAEAAAQGRGFDRGGFAARGPGLVLGDRGPGIGNRGPGLIGDRIPGRRPGIIVRFPGGLMVPHNDVPVVVQETNPVRRVTKGQSTPPTKQAQTAPRGGFTVPAAGETRFVPDEVILTIAGSVPNTTLETIARQHRLTRLESQEFAVTGDKMFRWRINDRRSVASVIRALQADTRIIAAQPNYIYTLASDPNAKAGGASDLPQYALDKLRLAPAHAIARGDSVLVAVIDTPIDAMHPDLYGAVAGTFDAMGTGEKPRAHGTAMAGAIAARGKLTGTAPAVKILAIQAFGTARSEGTTFDIRKGLEWAIQQKVNVVNMSFAGPSDPALSPMLSAAREKGIVLVAAAGNAGPRSQPLYPAADPNVIAVTASDADDKLYAQANRGSHIAVAAPGVNVLVTAPEAGYDMTSGTSVAAAEVSGIVALMIERNRKLDPTSVRRLLMSTARDLGPSGKDDQFGAGLVDAQGVLAALGAAPVASGETAEAR